MQIKLVVVVVVVVQWELSYQIKNKRSLQSKSKGKIVFYVLKKRKDDLLT